MTKTFLFRFDGARENDEFLEQARSKGHLVYSGIAIKLKRGWIPDFIEVSLDEDSPSCSVTIFELESNENDALVSARKYLPESSQGILLIFRQYLQRVLQRCSSSADPRVEDIQKLNDALVGHSSITIWTAGALRQPPQIIERLQLIDQGYALDNPEIGPQIQTQPTSFVGELSLSPRQHKTVSRSILILDALTRGWDKSDASLRAWRNLRSQPLRRQIQQRRENFPTLFALIIGHKSGVRILINDAARELSVIWNEFQPGQHSESTVLAAITKFMPVDRTLDPNASVRVAFEKARLILSDDAA